MHIHTGSPLARTWPMELLETSGLFNCLLDICPDIKGLLQAEITLNLSNREIFNLSDIPQLKKCIDENKNRFFPNFFWFSISVGRRISWLWAWTLEWDCLGSNAGSSSGFVIFGNLLNLSVPQASHLYEDNDSTYFLVLNVKCMNTPWFIDCKSCIFHI